MWVKNCVEYRVSYMYKKSELECELKTVWTTVWVRVQKVWVKTVWILVRVTKSVSYNVT